MRGLPSTFLPHDFYTSNFYYTVLLGTNVELIFVGIIKSLKLRIDIYLVKCQITNIHFYTKWF